MKPFATLDERKEFIKTVALRHKREDEYLKSLSVMKEEDDEIYAATVQAEFEALKKRSIKIDNED